MGTCEYWDCKRKVRKGYFLCAEHYEGFQDEDIDKCPECGKYKDADYRLCLRCKRKASGGMVKVEWSNKWRVRDSGDGECYVYILRLDDGSYYVGHTDDLYVRLTEHRSGKHQTTKGRGPVLKYFEVLKDRVAAVNREVELKELCRDNLRKLRRMIVRYEDLLDEVGKE